MLGFSEPPKSIVLEISTPPGAITRVSLCGFPVLEARATSHVSRGVRSCCSRTNASVLLNTRPYNFAWQRFRKFLARRAGTSTS